MIHDREFRKLRRADLQNAIDTCGREYPTLEMICVIIRGVYKFAMQNDLIDRDYSRFVDISRHQPEEDPEPMHHPFTAEEIEILWKAESDPSVREILMLIYSGLRIGEFLALTPEDIDSNSRIITIRAAKTKAGRRRVPIAAKTAGMWDELREARKNREGGIFKTEYAAFVVRMKKACHQAGIFAHLPHDTRHPTASLLRRAGVDPYITKLILGHATNDLTEKVYTHIPESTLIEAIDKI
jgi:integrase